MVAVDGVCCVANADVSNSDATQNNTFVTVCRDGTTNLGVWRNTLTASLVGSVWFYG